MFSSFMDTLLSVTRQDDSARPYNPIEEVCVCFAPSLDTDMAKLLAGQSANNSRKSPLPVDEHGQPFV